MKRRDLWLLAILLLALGLRLWGIGFGLPGVFHPDEERIVHHALAFGMGDLNPHYFNYPSLSMYLLFIKYGAFYVIGRLVGLFGSIADFQVLFFSDPTAFYLIGRATNALWGTATVLLVYLLGRRAYGVLAGLVAALILAITHLHVTSSHYISTDVLLTFFIAAAFLPILNIMQRGETRDYAWAGVLAGLGAAAKYNAATLALPIALAHCWSPSSRLGGVRRVLDGRLWLAAGCMLAAFFVASPYCFLDFTKFWADFSFISEHMEKGVYSTGGGRHWSNYLLLFVRDPMNSAPSRWSTLGLFYLVGAGWGLVAGKRKGWMLLAYPGLYILMVGSWGKINNRYLIPVFPPLAVLAGGAVAALWKMMSPRPFFRIGLTTAGLVLVVVPVRNIALNDMMLARTDTREEARLWIEANIPFGSTVALEWDNNATVQLKETAESIEGKARAYQEGRASTIHHTSEQMARVHELRLQASGGTTYRILRIGEVDRLTLIPEGYDLDELRRRGVDYLVVSSEIYHWFRGEKGREKYPVHAAFYDNLFTRKPLKEFTPQDQPGPVIRIYRIAEQIHRGHRTKKP